MKKKESFRNLLNSILRPSLIVLVLGIFISCGSSGSSIDNAEFNELKDLVDSRNFRIENDWANPMGGNRINLIGNPNYIIFKGDSVDVYLPYFGVRHSGAGYNGEGGIKYTGLYDELKINEKPNKGRIELEFSARNKTEMLDIYIKLYPGNKSTTNINTSQRATISYDGDISEVRKD